MLEHVHGTNSPVGHELGFELAVSYATLFCHPAISSIECTANFLVGRLRAT